MKLPLVADLTKRNYRTQHSIRPITTIAYRNQLLTTRRRYIGDTVRFLRSFHLPTPPPVRKKLFIYVAAFLPRARKTLRYPHFLLPYCLL